MNKDLRKYLKNHERIKRAIEDCKTFNDDQTKTVYPKGVRAFKCQPEFSELDGACSLAAAAAHKLEIILPHGCSRKQAMSIMHWETAKFMKRMDCEALEHHKETLKPRIQKTELFKLIKQVIHDELQAPDADGLEAPRQRYMPDEAISSHVESIYSEIFEKFMKEQADAKIKIEKEEADKKKNRKN
jgi:hypothetical protein